MRLQRGRNGEADRLFRARFIRDHQIGVQRIQIARDALDRRVKRLKVNGDIRFAFHGHSSFRLYYTRKATRGEVNINENFHEKKGL